MAENLALEDPALHAAHAVGGVGLRFGVSSHTDRTWSWFATAFGSDVSGEYAGVPYDGNMTAADGIGKWWEGLDPSELYGLPPEKRTPEWIQKVKEN